ncbi:MAG: hypothetical protein KBA14_01230 [Saprospiraceae bacterium]|nr:hypothetical protein [Saprospiraceae bacterium]
MYSSTQHSILQITCFFIWIGLIASCSGTTQPQTELKETIHTSVAFDTIQKARIDSMVNTINAGLKASGGPKKLPYPLYNPNDTLYYWELKDDASRISIEWQLPNEIVWPTFFVYKGELVFVRFRFMHQEPPANSRVFESMIYLDKGVIIYCEERGQPLQEGESPGVLRLKEYSRSTRTYAEIETDYKDYWKTVRTFMEQNNVLPSYIKG